MLLRKLIETLEALEKEELKHADVMGEPEIMIDVFEKHCGMWFYKGFGKNISITRSADGVYPILTADDTRKEKGR